MFKRPHYIALILVIILVVILFNLPAQTSSNLKLAIGSLFVPLFGLSTSTKQLSEKAGNATLPRRELLRQNEQLRTENEQLKLRATQTEEVWRENNQLRQQLGWLKQNPKKYKLAHVVARDPANWWRTVQIDLGTRDGLRENLPVRTIEGLVGKTSQIGTTRSQVLLLGDPNLRVSALIQETRETGIIFSGSSNPMEYDLFVLGYLARTSGVKPGQTVFTSGDGGIFPKGIPVGQVVDFRMSDNGLTMEARVKLTARLSALEEVWVVME